MKRTCLLLLLMCLLSVGARATIDVWVGPTGSFTDDSKWQNGGPSTWATTSGDEIKMTNNDTVCTVDTAAGVYGHKLAVASGGTNGMILEIVDGGSLTVGEAKIGDGGATGNGDLGSVIQTGGTFTVSDLEMGYKTPGVGYYTISGGTLNFSGNGRIKLGCEGNAGSTGTFTVVGTGGTIQMDELHVGYYNSAGDVGTGILEYQIAADGVSAIMLSDKCQIDGGADTSIANLLLSATAPLAAADIVLVDVTSGNATTGIFDALNGGSAAEGTMISLGGNMYSLTYAYDAELDLANNDIALVYVPEPATMLLLGLGGLLAIRKKR